jgi:glycosyltransferase involved in cell wall biosynthesis
MSAPDPLVAQSPARLTWSHCIPTLNRMDILAQAVRLSLDQTCPPTEIIIVDAGDEVDANRTRIEAIFAEHQGPKPDLVYLASPVKSLTRQRNIAIERARGDILFLFDDDTLMFPDCAAEILKVYAADDQQQIAAGMAQNVPDLPGKVQVADVDRKAIGDAALRKNGLRDSPLFAWVWDKVFMMNALYHFVAYDTPQRMTWPDMVTVGPLYLLRVPLLSGFAMTVRAGVARKEPFDANLLSYCPAEDLDASYRFSRHGMNVLIETALVHHFEAAGGRIKRRQAITLGLMNVASFVAKNSSQRRQNIRSYYTRYLRRLLAEFLKDGLSRRYTFPQFLGALSAFWPSVSIFRHSRDGFDDWYRAQQRRVLKWPATDPGPVSGQLSSQPNNQGIRQ